MQAVINETPLPIDLYRYVDVSGRVEQFGKFSVIFYDLNQVMWMFVILTSVGGFAVVFDLPQHLCLQKAIFTSVVR